MCGVFSTWALFYKVENSRSSILQFYVHVAFSSVTQSNSEGANGCESSKPNHVAAVFFSHGTFRKENLQPETREITKALELDRCRLKPAVHSFYLLPS